MTLHRILELVDVLGECEFLPPGPFYEWARMSALRELRRLIRYAVENNLVGYVGQHITSELVNYVESPS